MPLAIWGTGTLAMLWASPSSASKIQQACSAWATWAHSLDQILCVSSQVSSRQQQHARYSSLECATETVGVAVGGFCVCVSGMWAVASQLSAYNAAKSDSIDRQTNPQTQSNDEEEEKSNPHTHTPTASLNNSPHRPDISFARLLNIFLLLLPFFYGSRAEAKDAEKFILNEKLFQLHQRK